MYGIITYFDKEKKEGCIQSEDGRLLNFKEDSFGPNLNVSFLDADVKVVFDADENGNVSSLMMLNEQPLLDEKIYYAEPSQIGIARESVPEGYELIDKSEYLLTREARSSKSLKLFLIDDCSKFGGNVLLDYTEEQVLRNSIGFSYYIYRGSACPAIMGKRDDNAPLSLYDLKHKLNHEKLLKYHQDEQNSRTGLKIAKISGLILLIIFTVGFILSLDR